MQPKINQPGLRVGMQNSLLPTLAEVCVWERD